MSEPPERLSKKDKEKQIWKGGEALLWNADEDHQEKRDQHRKEWLILANHEDPDFPQEVAEKRIEALTALYAMLSRPDNREPIWADHKVREALLSSAEAGRDDLVRCLAVGCYVKLTLSRAIRKQILQDEAAFKMIVVNAGREAPLEARERAYLVLANLGLQLTDKSKEQADKKVAGEEEEIGAPAEYDFLEQLLKSLAAGTSKTLPAEVRSRVFGSLWSMAASACNRREMWKNLDIRAAILQGASIEEESRSTRSNALAVIWSLTGDELNRSEMWEHDDTRAAILSAITSDQPNASRIHGLNALRIIGILPEVQEALWTSDDVRTPLLEAIEAGQPADVCTSGLQLLIQLSWNYRNGKKMAQAGLRERLAEAAQDDQLEAADRRSCKWTASRLEGAEDWELSDEEKEGEEQPEGADTPEDAQAADVSAPEASGAGEEEQPADPEAAAGVDATIPPGAGALQTGVLERAAGGFG